MMHETRIFVVANIPTAEELADTLVDHTWCPCNGFRLGGYLFLNDSTSPDGAQEYGVVREKDMIQVESITFGWMKLGDALDSIKRTLAGEFQTEYAHCDGNKIETGEEHGRCGHCA